MSKEPFHLNLQVLLESILYLLSKGKPLSRFYLAKMIYYADREHLFKYGKPITGDKYVAMRMGPVPSKAYDIMKVAANEENDFLEERIQSKTMEILGADDQGNFLPKRSPDMNYLANSYLECLDWAFDYANDKTIKQISDETHEHSGYKNVNENDLMSYWDIIEDAEDGKDLKEYLEESIPD